MITPSGIMQNILTCNRSMLYKTLNSCLNLNIQGIQWLCCSCHKPSNAKSIAEQGNKKLKKTLPT